MKKPLNILCIVTDDQPREWFNCSGAGRDASGRGRSLTPTLDALAARGCVLDQFYTPSPLCVPTRFSYMTGYYPSRARNSWFTDLHKLHNHTFIHQEPKITPDVLTVAKRFKELGYCTAALGKNHAIEVPGWRMLDRNADPYDPAVMEAVQRNRHLVDEAYHAAGFDHAERIHHTNPSVYPQEIGVHNMEWLVEGACQVIDRCAGQPFFIYLATTLPHGPRSGWKKHSPLMTPYGPLQHKPRTTMPERSTIPARLASAGYDEEDNRGDLLWLDDGLRAVLHHLETKGLLEDTLIYFGTDHGIDAKASVYEPGVHITSLFAGPGIAGGRTSQALCVVPDIPATLLDYAGGDPSGMDGRSLRPVLEGDSGKIQDAIYLEFGHTRTVIRDKWKYVALRYSDYTRNMDLPTRHAWLEAAEAYLQRCHEPFTFKTNDPMGPFGQSGYIPDGWSHERVAMRKYPHYYDADQLYNLEDDPGETVNLAASPSHSSILADLKDLLVGHLQDKPGGFGEFKKAEYDHLTQEERAAIGRQLMDVVFH